jgi:hypothetical protein
MTTYTGQDVVYTMTATDPSGDPANPVGVRFKVKDPSGTVTTYVYGVDTEVQETVAGEAFTLTFDSSSAGQWSVRGEILDADQNVVGVAEDVMLVQASYI